MGCVERLQLRRDGFESLAPRWRCADEHAAPVRGVGQSLDEARLLEAVEEPGGVGRPVEQAVGHGADGDADVGIVGEAEGPEGDVLRVGEVLGATDGLELLERPVGEEQDVHVDLPPDADGLRFAPRRGVGDCHAEQCMTALNNICCHGNRRDG